MNWLIGSEVFDSGYYTGLLSVLPDEITRWDQLPPNMSHAMIRAHFTFLRQAAQRMGLVVTEDGCDEILIELDKASPSPARIRQCIIECKKRLVIEMEGHVFLHVASERKSLYVEPFAKWEKTLSKRQANAAFDIEEGSKSLALERNTACVFHMMRLMELGLKNMASELGITLDWYERSWEKMLTRIQDEITKRNKSNDTSWTSRRQFFEESYGTLNAVRIAWRNPTMHVEKQYDSERADHIYRMVRDFMEHLYATLT